MERYISMNIAILIEYNKNKKDDNIKKIISMKVYCQQIQKLYSRLYAFNYINIKKANKTILNLSFKAPQHLI